MQITRKIAYEPEGYGHDAGMEFVYYPDLPIEKSAISKGYLSMYTRRESMVGNIITPLIPGFGFLLVFLCATVPAIWARITWWFNQE